MRSRAVRNSIRRPTENPQSLSLAKADTLGCFVPSRAAASNCSVNGYCQPYLYLFLSGIGEPGIIEHVAAAGSHCILCPHPLFPHRIASGNPAAPASGVPARDLSQVSASLLRALTSARTHGARTPLPETVLSTPLATLAYRNFPLSRPYPARLRARVLRLLPSPRTAPHRARRSVRNERQVSPPPDTTAAGAALPRHIRNALRTLMPRPGSRVSAACQRLTRIDVPFPFVSPDCIRENIEKTESFGGFAKERQWEPAS